MFSPSVLESSGAKLISLIVGTAGTVQPSSRSGKRAARTEVRRHRQLSRLTVRALQLKHSFSTPQALQRTARGRARAPREGNRAPTFYAEGVVAPGPGAEACPPDGSRRGNAFAVVANSVHL